MIRLCSVCGAHVETKFKLDFQDIPGLEEKIYTQNIAVCENCGYIFTQNPFSDEQLENRYKNMSKYEYDSKDYVLSNEFKEQSIRQLNFLKENIDFNFVDSILEVGAASGYNLSLYKDICKRVTGIEPSENNCKLAKRIYNVDMFNGMFDDYLTSVEKDKYDIIFLSMVLEHIVDPIRFILACKEICNKYIFIEVPTLDIRHQEGPYGVFSDEHVSLFTLDSLNELMKRAGFKLVNVETIYGIKRCLPAGYPAIATIWEYDENSTEFRFNLYSSHEMFDKYISFSNNQMIKIEQKITKIPSSMKIAIWGVGNPASMLLANTSLIDKNIVRVYDSDVRKQGFTFADVEITAFKKSDIEMGIIEGIIITTYTAQNAIENYLKEINLDCKIFKLYDV